MPKITKLRLNLSKLCLEHRGLFFPGHGVHTFPAHFALFHIPNTNHLCL